MTCTVDSFGLLWNQMYDDISNYNCLITRFCAGIGAYYALKFVYAGCSSVIQSSSSLLQLLVKENLANKYGRWAMVTGPTSGIGKEIALELASKGINIVLVGRDHEKLKLMKDTIEQNFGVHSYIIEVNLEKVDGKVWNTIHDLSMKVDIGILVNNAGVSYNYPMQFEEVSFSRVNSIMEVNASALVKITHAVLPGMLKRKRGLIVNMSSAAGMLHSPMISLYSASKKFVDHFSQSLRHELAASNIHVQSLTPMYISTKMTAFSYILHWLSTFTPSPRKYAKHAVRTFGKYDQNTGYFPHTLQTWIISIVPSCLSMYVGKLLHHRLNKEGREMERKRD